MNIPDGEVIYLLPRKGYPRCDTNMYMKIRFEIWGVDNTFNVITSRSIQIPCISIYGGPVYESNRNFSNRVYGGIWV